MNGQEILNAFLAAFPQHAEDLKTHIADYGKLLPHIFYAETISEPLIQLPKPMTGLLSKNTALSSNSCGPPGMNP